MAIAIIGTAGRDKSKPMNKELWLAMVADVVRRIPRGSHVVSGGAAWADHLAVELFLTGHAHELTLHLPAPIKDLQFVGPYKSAASAANYYHKLFSEVIGRNSIAEIVTAAAHEHCYGTIEAEAPGYGAMFARNAKVAQQEYLLAYTFGEGFQPTDGGTVDTWNKCTGERYHVPLSTLI